MSNKNRKNISSIEDDFLRKFVVVLAVTVMLPIFFLLVVFLILIGGVSGLLRGISESLDRAADEFIAFSCSAGKAWEGSIRCNHKTESK